MGVPADLPAALLCTRSSSLVGFLVRSTAASLGQATTPAASSATTGVGWLIAAVVLVALSLLVFAGELRGPAVAVTAVDDAVVGGWPGCDGPVRWRR